MNPNKIRTFICKRCSQEKEGHFNTKFCDDCVSIPYKCSCSAECTTMVKASGNRKNGFTFPRYADKHCFRTFICTRCNVENEQLGTGKSREICTTCLNKLNLCECGCGKFVRASHNNSQLISGHNTSLISSEEMKRRGQKSLEARKKNGKPWHSSESRKKLSKSVAKAHKEGKLKNSHGIRHSKGELSLKPYLEPLGYIHSEDKSLRISSGFRTRYPDYYNPHTKQIVEYFGTYWHRDRILPKGKKHATEQEVINWYQKQGWSCTVIWENEVSEMIEHFQDIEAGVL